VPRRARAVLLSLFAIALAGLFACSKDDKPAATLPEAPTLLGEASTAMRDVTTAHIKIETQGDLAELPLRRADGDLTKEGDAKGTIQIEQLGALIEYEFVMKGDTIWLKGVTGGWQPLPAALAASVYDPSAILDPNRGVSKVLSTATEATTEAQEDIDGRATYRVAAKLDPTAASALVPGVGPGVTGKLWFDAETKQLRRAVLNVPAAPPGGQPAVVTIDFTDIGKPVTVSAP
jgi:lipoprotein LprG